MARGKCNRHRPLLNEAVCCCRGSIIIAGENHEDLVATILINILGDHGNNMDQQQFNLDDLPADDCRFEKFVEKVVSPVEMSLTQEQQTFIEECKLEFADRYTDKDPDYKNVYDKGIPDPPIMCPWYMRSRNNYRDRAGGSQPHNDRRNNREWEQQNYSRNRNQNNRYASRDRPY